METEGKKWQDCRVAIGLCVNQDKLDKPLLFNILSMEKPSEYMIIHQGKHIKANSLNRLVELARKEACDKILFCDADMEFPNNTLPKLLSHNVPIVSGLYHIKTYPFSPVAGWTEDRGSNLHRVNGRGRPWKHDYYPLPHNELVEVHWTGIGCLLVDMKVFDNIKFPCFYDTWDFDKGCRAVGHDLVFCDAAIKAGYKVHVDTSVDCGHRMVLTVDKMYVEAFHRSKMVEVVKELLKEYGVDTQSRRAERDRIDMVEEVAQYAMVMDTPNTPEYWNLKWRGEFIEPAKIIQRAEVDDVVTKLVPDGESVGDFGCGITTTLMKLKYQKKCSVMGYDFSKECVEYMETLGIPVTLTDLRTFEPNGHKYHTMIMSHVLEHFVDSDVDSVLQKIRDMTEYQAIIVVPQEKSMDSVPCCNEHMRIYTEKTLRQALKPYFSSVTITKVKPNKKEKDRWVNRHLIAHCLVEDRESEEVNLTRNRLSVGETVQ